MSHSEPYPYGPSGATSTVPRPGRPYAAPRPAADGEGLLRRGLGAAGLLGIALIHVLDLPGKLEETPYLGVGYIALIAGCLLAAEWLVRRESIVGWLLGGGLAAATLLGYGVNRTIGLPGATDDIGNWLEPLGLASLFVEALVVLLAALALVRLSARD
jgi:hypothetical protein